MQAPELPSQVESLLRAVNSTNDFEAEMSQRFGGTGAALSEEVRPPPKLIGPEGLNARDQISNHKFFSHYLDHLLFPDPNLILNSR